MMGIGFTEMIIIAGIALVLLGPEKFPDFAKMAVRTLRDLRSYLDEIKREIAKEVKPLERELNEIARKSDEVYREILTETEPDRYTNKGYIGSSNYVEHAVSYGATSSSSTANEDDGRNQQYSDESKDTDQVEQITEEEKEYIPDPYDPDVPQADLMRKENIVEAHHDEDFHAGEDSLDSIKLPDRLDG